MAFLKCALVCVALVALVAAAPVPEPEPGFWGPKHEHIVVHVPYKVHNVHHHHVHKVAIPYVKHVPIIKEVYTHPIIHHDFHDIHDHHHHGWW